MQAVTYDRYGGPDVLGLEDIPVEEPGRGQVRLRVHASSVNPYEFHFVRGEPLFMRLIIGLRRPRVRRLGRDVAGVVDAVGPGVTDFTVGDEVYGSADGAYAEYALASVDKLAAKPPSLSWAEAAALPMCAYTGLQGLDAAAVGPGTRVLVNGASGGIGHLTVQMAKAMGATVVATCKTENVDWVGALGADEVIDYTTDSCLDHGPYDAILDNVVNHPLIAWRRALAHGGTYAWIGAAKMGKILGPLPQLAWAKMLDRKDCRMLVVDSNSTRDHLDRITAWVEAGQLKPRIEQVLPLDRVGDGIAHVEQGHTKGKTVIQVRP